MVLMYLYLRKLVNIIERKFLVDVLFVLIFVFHPLIVVLSSELCSSYTVFVLYPRLAVFEAFSTFTSFPNWGQRRRLKFNWRAWLRNKLVPHFFCKS